MERKNTEHCKRTKAYLLSIFIQLIIIISVIVYSKKSHADEKFQFDVLLPTFSSLLFTLSLWNFPLQFLVTILKVGVIFPEMLLLLLLLKQQQLLYYFYHVITAIIAIKTKIYLS